MKTKNTLYSLFCTNRSKEREANKINHCSVINGRSGGLMVSELVSGSSPGWGYCVVLGQGT